MNPLLAIKPICAVCNKPVDEVIVVRSAFEPVRRFRVVCHGQSEEFEMPEELWEFGIVEMGKAFERKRIGHDDTDTKK